MSTLESRHQTEHSPTDARVVLTVNQDLIWVGQQMHDGVPLYDMVHLYPIETRIDPQRFQAAFDRLIRNVECLQCVFPPEVSAEPHLLRRSDPPEACGFVDLRQSETPDLDADQLIQQRIQEPLPYRRVLYDALLIRTGEARFRWYLKVHHIVTDAANGRALLKGLEQEYVATGPESCQTSHAKYSDYREFERQLADRPAYKKAIAWWHERIRPQPPTRFFQKAPADPCSQHVRRTIVLNANQQDDLVRAAASPPYRQISTRLGEFNIIATALACWLHRMNGTKRFNFGATAHGRTTPAFRDTVGVFMQVLPLKAEVTPEDTFRSLAARLSTETFGFLKYSLPGVSTTAVPGSFDVVLNLPELKSDGFLGTPVDIEWPHHGFGDPQRKLTVSFCGRSGGGAELHFDFNVSEFNEFDQQRAIEQIISLIETVAREPDQKVADVPILTDQELRLLEQLDGGASHFPMQDNVWDLFRKTAVGCPERNAVAGTERHFTYQELLREAVKLGEELEGRAASKLVPVVCRRNASSIVAMLGVLAADRCFLPIDADLPAERIQDLLNDAGATVVIDATDGISVCPAEVVSRSANETDVSHACYVLYTSGSTGHPNGVVVGHQSLLNLLFDFEHLAPDAGLKCSWWTNVGFDVSMYEIFSALLFGRTLYIPSEKIRNDADRWLSWCRRHRISSAYLPAFFLNRLADLTSHSRIPLRRLLVGVEPISWELLRTITANAPDLVIINGYGPTEATVCATLMRIRPTDDCNGGPAPIGYAVSGNRCRVVDAYGNDVPPGVRGELQIGGRGLAIGYLGRDVLNKTRFVNRRLGGKSERWYRTGDLVRQHARGYLEFLGRIDSQLKINGQRIEPDEIAAHILDIDGVDESCVAGIQNTGSQRLIAWFCSDSVDSDQLRHQLMKRLPLGLIPQHLVPVDALPRTSNGKVDTDRLLKLPVPMEEQNLEPPGSASEVALFDFWTRIFDSATFGVDHSFFALGGDSLDAIRLVSMCTESGIEISPSDVFDCPSIRSLAARIDERLSDVESTQQLAPNGSGNHRNLTLAYGDGLLSTQQQRLWYLAKLNPSDPAYHLQILLRVRGPLDPERLQSCLVMIVERHPALRTNIIDNRGEPCAVLRDDDLVACELIDLTANQGSVANEDVADLVRGRGREPFDLSADPLVRLLVVKQSGNSFLVAVTVHHVAVDHYSIRLLLDELQSIYAFPDQDAAFGRTEVSSEYGFRSCTDATFWESYLDGCPTVLHFWIADAHGTRTTDGKHCEFVIPPRQSQQLHALAASNDVPLNTVMLAAFQLLLHRCAATGDLLTGVPISTRSGLSSSTAMGFHVESLPVRSRYDGSWSFREFLRRTKESFAEVLDHRDAAFNDIVKSVSAVRTSGNPLFQHMFVMQPTLPELQLKGDIQATVVPGHLGGSKFDLTMFVMPRAQQLDCCIEYCSTLFSEQAIETIRAFWCQILGAICSTPGIPLEQLGIMGSVTATRRSRVVAPSAETFPAPNIYALFEQQVIASPDEPAISFQGRVTPYSALLDSVEQFSGQLQRHGVAKHHRVALLLDRSPETIAMILAILRLGAAYVPISTAAGRDRISAVLEDCQPHLVVIEEKKSEITTCGIPVLQLGESTEPGVRPEIPPAAEPRADDVAYVIYTSGSTGQPNGVQITHRNLMSSTQARQEYYDAAPGRFLLLSSCAFDSSVAGIFWTLTTGGTLVLPESDAELNVKAIAALIEVEQVTHSLCLPSLYQLIIRHATPGQLQSLQTMIVAGESCDASTVAEHNQLLPDTELHNEYGPTEATVWVTAAKLAPGAPDEPISIGKPIGNNEILLLDSDLQPVPLGTKGEICIAGEQLAKSYLNRQQLTAERFPSHPFAARGSDRIYRTGDLATQNATGNIYFHGRIDHQLKVSGHRVEAEEVESAIRSIPSVQEAVVGLADLQQPVSSDPKSLIQLLEALNSDEADRLLSAVESYGDTDRIETITYNEDSVKVTFEFSEDEFISPPRTGQRRWLLDQSLREAADNLRHLNQIAPLFVSGNDTPHRPDDNRLAPLNNQEIMEDWQLPLMQAMAEYAAASHGDVLEVGFGRGVSATMLQTAGVKSHTIVEMSLHSIEGHFLPWRDRYPDRDIQLVEGRWQDVLSELKTYDAVFFHAFPMNESEFVEYVTRSVTFAEHFFPVAASLLRPGGVFTYLTTEIDSLSRQHQRSLFTHFDEVKMKVVSLDIPNDTKDAWWADSMVVLQASVQSSPNAEGDCRDR